MENAKTVRRRVGRPLSFDRDKALEAAMLQFWRTGFETTSVTDLTTAMGITPPSLYATFGDKERLFLECLRLYKAPAWPDRERVRLAPTAREAAQRILLGSAAWFTQADKPPGCLIATSAITGSEDSVRVRAELSRSRDELRTILEERIRDDIRAGHLPKGTKARALALFTVGIMQGMATLARDGGSRKELLAMAEQAMAAWPA